MSGEREKKPKHEEEAKPLKFPVPTHTVSPKSPKRHMPFLVPSPPPCRRTRTSSQSRLAAESPLQTGTVTSFCRQKGHGFVRPDDDESKQMFLHISDVEGEFVLKEGDKVEFRTILIPPKNVEKQAVEVRIIKMGEGPHEKWSNTPHLF